MFSITLIWINGYSGHVFFFLSLWTNCVLPFFLQPCCKTRMSQFQVERAFGNNVVEFSVLQLSREMGTWPSWEISSGVKLMV